jgi:hypothetical protein
VPDAIAAKMPMMATTIINSIKVKPCCTFFMIEKPLLILKRFPLHRRVKRLGGYSASAVPRSAPMSKLLQRRHFQRFMEARRDGVQHIGGERA